MVKWLKLHVIAAGHQQILWKSDQEPAVLALRDELRRQVPEVAIISETSATRDSQGNGAIEKANELVANQIRVLKTQLEEDTGEKFASDHPAISWLIVYAAVSHNMCHVNHTGKTAYEMQRGRKMPRPLLFYGEDCLYHPCGTTTRQAKLEPRWQEGTFVGVLEHSLEYLIATEDGTVAKCRDVKRLMEGAQFTSGRLKGLKAQPWLPRPSDQDSIEIMDAPPTHPTLDPRAHQPMQPGEERGSVAEAFKRAYITRRLVRNYGATAGCPGCLEANRPHTEECRAKMIRKIREDEQEADLLRRTRPRDADKLLAEPATTTAATTTTAASSASSGVKRPAAAQLEPNTETVPPQGRKRTAETEAVETPEMREDYEQGRAQFEDLSSRAHAA
eukprot:6469495-Amphidinium_carterae.1